MLFRVRHIFTIVAFIFYIGIGVTDSYAQRSGISAPDESVLDYAYQRVEGWSGGHFADRRSFWSSSYYSVGVGMNSLWGSDQTLDHYRHGFYSQGLFGYRLSPVHNVEVSAAYGLLPYADWQVDRLGSSYYDVSYTDQFSVGLKYLFNVTSYASKLEDPGRFELLLGFGFDGRSYGSVSDGFDFGLSTSMRMKYNVTNLLSLYVDGELAVFDSSLGGDALVAESYVLMPSVEFGLMLRVSDDSSERKFGCGDWGDNDLRGVGLRTNMFYWAGAILNIGVELPIFDHFSVIGEFGTSWYRSRHAGYAYQLLVGGVECRYYLSPQRRGLYGGLSGMVGYFDLLVSEGDGVRSELSYSGGVTVGYYLPLSRCLGLDFSVTGGLLRGDFLSYTPDEEFDCLVYNYTTSVNYYGPVNGRLSIVWSPRFKFGKGVVR